MSDIKLKALELAQAAEMIGGTIDATSEAVINRARKYADFLAGTRDTEIVRAARTFAQATTGEPGTPGF